MIRGPALENLTAAIVEIARSGVRPEALGRPVLARLRRAVPFDAAFWSTVDPATLLFTQPYRDDIPAATVPDFIRNEFLDDDVNKWMVLAHDRLGVATLLQATAGTPETSRRYREIFRPLGVGDELRAVLRGGGACWGYLCLLRQGATPFSEDETRYVRALAPHLAEGIRAGLRVTEFPSAPDAPGLVVLGADGAVVSATAAGERWLEELERAEPKHGLPVEVQAVAARSRRPWPAAAQAPRLQVRTRTGRWAVLHASRLSTGDRHHTAVIIEAASPTELAPVLMLAYGLTRQERTVAGMVCRGLSTRAIVDQLHITPNTVQDHLKSIFDKTDTRSRRELISRILDEQYLPRAESEQPLGPSGAFLA